jgi:release factor glutamine methyltransferase
VGGVQILHLPGVFRPISDSWLLAEAIQRESLGPEHRTLDLCTGSGIVAVAAAAVGAQATAVDVSRRALAATVLNATRNRLRVTVRRGDLYEPAAGERFDLISSNPPYVPSPRPHPPTRGLARAWEGGPSGRLVLDRICADARRHLLPGGRILVVHSSLIDEDETLHGLQAGGLVDAAVVERCRGPLGPLMREQQRLGTIADDIDVEDVVVVRAVAP